MILNKTYIWYKSNLVPIIRQFLKCSGKLSSCVVFFKRVDTWIQYIFHLNIWFVCTHWLYLMSEFNQNWSIFFIFFSNGKLERRFKQKQNVCQLIVLDRYIFRENVLFAQAIAQFFFKKKNGLKTSCTRLMLYMQKWRERLKLIISYF